MRTTSTLTIAQAQELIAAGFRATYGKDLLTVNISAEMEDRGQGLGEHKEPVPVIVISTELEKLPKPAPQHP